MLGIFSLLLYQSVHTFDADDPKPPLRHDTALQKGAVPISVGLSITNMPVFNLSENKFTADLIVWFEFDEKKVSLEQIGKFSFERGKIDEKSEPVLSKKAGVTRARYRVRVTFSSLLNHRRFPLNDHTLSLVLVNEYLDARTSTFSVVDTSFLIEPEVATDVWTVVNTRAEAGFFEDTVTGNEGESLRYPVVVFSIDLAKQGLRKVFIIMLPMLIIFIVASISFSLDPSTLASSILGLSTGSLTGLIAYMFVIERVEPNVGYFTFTDHMFNFFLVAIFSMYLVNLYAIRRGVNDAVLKALKGVVLLALQTLLIVMSFILSH